VPLADCCFFFYCLLAVPRELQRGHEHCHVVTSTVAWSRALSRGLRRLFTDRAWIRGSRCRRCRVDPCSELK
jgi:hypothetical protein